MSYENMTDQEIAEALAELHAVRDLREQLERAEEDKARIAAQVDDLLMQLQQLNGVQAGGEWVPPISASGAYPLGAVVTRKGFTWTNDVPSNPHEPGVSGWSIVPEVDPETGKEIPPPYVQPSGAHDAHPKGHRITWEDGLVYIAKRDGVVHTPAQAPEDWELVETEPEPEEPEPTDPDEDEPVDPEPEEPALPDWEVGKAYTTGNQFTYQGATYRVLQGHTSAAHWPPDQVASLYEVT